ncbi:MAG: trypsin-like peptidase domain-containing protein [Oscillospiraceae bacterium]|nr:trypsin-like peptidase domain-containing protein [Oscillospiraceae bacterium]
MNDLENNINPGEPDDDIVGQEPVDIQSDTAVQDKTQQADAANQEQPFPDMPKNDAEPAPLYENDETPEPVSRPYKGRRKKSYRGLVAALLVTGILVCATLGVLVWNISVGSPNKLPTDIITPDGQETDDKTSHIILESVPSGTDKEMNDGMSAQEIAELVSPSVVSIKTYAENSIAPVSGGSGIVISQDGYIVTNAHVILGYTAISVELTNGDSYMATIVGTDPRTDVGVLKINAQGLTVPQYGSSDDVRVGESVLAIGNPGALSGTVTRGIISGLNREMQVQIDGSVYTMSLLQTDAAINPGNSGGALVNRFGQVIAINSSKIISEAYEGVGFAIPMNIAQPVIDNIINYGYVKDRAALGVTVIPLNETVGQQNGLPSQGLYISKIEESSNLNVYGIQVGDVIKVADGVELEENNDLVELIQKKKPGETIVLEIWKKSTEETVTISAVLIEAPQQ